VWARGHRRQLYAIRALSADLDEVDRSKDLVAQAVRDGGVAGVVCGGILALGAGDVGEVRLDELSDVRVLVLLAADQVADQGDGVSAVCCSSRVNSEREVAVAAALFELCALDEL